MWVLPKNRETGAPKWMVKIMENLIKVDDLRGKPTIFGNIHVKMIKRNKKDTLKRWVVNEVFVVGEAGVFFFFRKFTLKVKNDEHFAEAMNGVFYLPLLLGTVNYCTPVPPPQEICWHIF